MSEIAIAGVLKMLRSRDVFDRQAVTHDAALLIEHLQERIEMLEHPTLDALDSAAYLKQRHAAEVAGRKNEDIC